VLPFANMSRNQDDEYFSDGLSEEIINVLAHIPGLKVIARTSAFAFRGKEQDIRRIAEALGVRNILEGSVRRAGNRIRVTTQLISAQDGSHLWSERYDREMADVQDEIAGAIAAVLRIKLAVQPSAARQYTPNLASYEALLQAWHHIAKYTPESMTKAGDYLERAIALDPGYAVAHSALGVYFNILALLGLPTHPRGRRASKRWPLIHRSRMRWRCWVGSRRLTISTGKKPSGCSDRRWPRIQSHPWSIGWQVTFGFLLANTSQPYRRSSGLSKLTR
jgi:TolB-like protein